MSQNINSPLFTTFIDQLNTSKVFSYNPLAYCTIKKYTFDFVSYNLRQNPGYMSKLEFQEFERELKIFNNEILGKTNIYYDRQSYESFVIEAFKPINFEICDKNTIVIASSLISVMSIYGDISEKFAAHQNYLKYRINQIDQNIHLSQKNQFTPSNLADNIISANQKLKEFTTVKENSNKELQKDTLSKEPVNISINTNQTMLSNQNLNQKIDKNDTGFKPKNKKDEVVERKDNPLMPSDSVLLGLNTNGVVTFESLLAGCQNFRMLNLPIIKGTLEYRQLKEVIKEHLMLSEQEALYNKINNSKAHLDVALYYLNTIQH